MTPRVPGVVPSPQGTPLSHPTNHAHVTVATGGHVITPQHNTVTSSAPSSLVRPLTHHSKLPSLSRHPSSAAGAVAGAVATPSSPVAVPTTLLVLGANDAPTPTSANSKPMVLKANWYTVHHNW
jgi:hypothetical protein